MATLILGTVGGLIGGRVGKLVGTAVGSIVDQATFAPAPRQGPRLTDLAVQTSSYGSAIPKLFGRVRVAGTVAWSTDLVETRGTRSNGKGRAATDTYSYSASFAVLLSARAIVRFERIWADGKLLRGAGGDLKAELAALRVHTGDLDQSVDPLITAAEGADAPAWRGMAYAVFEGLQLADYGNRIPSLSFEVIADDAPIALGQAVASLAGVLADAGPGVTGLVAAGGSVRALAESLGSAFPMIVRDEGATRVRFAPLAAVPLATTGLGARADGEREGRGAISIAPLDTTPRTLTIGYSDPERDYQAGLQRVRRKGPGAREERIDLPVVLGAGVAAATSTRVLAMRGIERMRRQVSLPLGEIERRPGDALTLDGAQWRIAAMRFEAMCVRLDLVRHAVLAAGGAGSPGRSTAQPDVVHGPTVFAVVDLPPTSDAAADRASVAVFASGTTSGWRRASLLASIDGGATFVDAGSTALPARLGRTATPLEPSSPWLEDRARSVEVVLSTPGDVLGNADDAALLAGANLAMIGDELVQFGRAEPLGAGRWRLGRLWRGRRGTEGAIVLHPVDTRFVVLDADSAAILAPGLALPGVMVMAGGIGDPLPWPTATCPTASRAFMPLSPVHLDLVPQANGDVMLTWVRRSRSGWAWRDGLDAPLGEEREAYRVSWAGGSAELAEPRFTYTAAMRASDLAAGRTAADFAIVQIGAVAASPPAHRVLSLI